MAEGSLSLGSLLALAAYQLRLFGPLRDLVSLVLQMARASASLARVAELWEMPGPRLARPQVTTVPSRLRAEGLEFGYDRPLLSGIDLEIEAGQMVVLVGPNGCGKSTLVKLMFGLETPSSGRFLIDDEVADPARARACMAWVPHEPFLLHASLRENLLWACPGAEQVRLDEALEVVGLSHWLAGLDDGWETTVGERGLALSDGQRQRLSLARAWLRGCGTLVLDEALSCLDPEAQDQILRRIKGQRTCLVLEHREQAMAFADVVYAMDAGGRLRPRQPV